MTTLRAWLNRLKTFDPDDWGEITVLQTAFSEEELNGELEAEIAFDTVGGTVWITHIMTCLSTLHRNSASTLSSQ